MNSSDPEITKPATLGSRLGTTFGPTLAGLAGGGLAGLLALPALAPLCRNVAATYALYPSLPRPWMAADLTFPSWLAAVALLVGLTAPVAMGAVAVWLARPRDVWADWSVGMTTALAGTLAAFASCVGWPVIMALVVVPSIADTTLVGDAIGHTEPAAHPSEALTRRYADLRAVPPERRGPAFMAKVVSDQVAGSGQAVWIGILAALLTAGVLAFSGTLAAGYLWRRGDGFGRAQLPYLEITLPLAGTLALGAGTVLASAWSSLLADSLFSTSGLTLAGLAVVSVLMVVGVIRRWPWLSRLGLAFTWVLILVQSLHEEVPWMLPAAAAILTVFLLLKQGVQGWRRVAVA